MNIMHAYFGAGCFWGVEAEFRKLDGVSSTSVGYMGGMTHDPTYEEVCTGTTGHAEVVEIEYDENMVSYTKLLDIFMNIHDPTQLNRQGPDIGTQYRSAIFVINNDQKELANEMIDNMNKNLNDSVVTSVEKKTEYYIGEEYHQKYLEKRGLASCHTNLM